MKIRKQLKSICALSFLLMFLTSSHADAEEVQQSKNSFGISFGGYSLSSSTEKLSSLGLLMLQYRRAFSSTWSAEVAFMNATSISGGYNSLFWGFDGGVSYAFGATFPRAQNISDVISIEQEEHYGLILSAGLSERSIPIASGTQSYSGIYFAVQPQYLLSKKLEIHARLQADSMVSSASTLTQTNFLVGLGFFF